MSDSGSFQIIASSLGPRACEILCVSFKSGVSISHSHLFGSPQSKPHWPSKPNVLEVIFLVQDPKAAEAMWGSDHLPLAEILSSCNYSPICGSLNQGYES